MPRRERRCSPTASPAARRRRVVEALGIRDARGTAARSSVRHLARRRARARLGITCLMPRAVLIAGLSTRAAGGFRGRRRLCRDLARRVRRSRCPSVGSSACRCRAISASLSAPRPAARAAAGFVADAVVYLANFENEPEAVTALAAGRTLWGNPRRCSAPRARSRVAGGRHPRTRPAMRTSQDRTRTIRTTLERSERSERLAGRSPLRRAEVEASIVDGWRRSSQPLPPGADRRGAGSVVFVAANGAAVPIGLSVSWLAIRPLAPRVSVLRQHPGAGRGSVFEQDDVLLDRACAIATAVTASFGLVGVNGVDFIAAAGEAYPIEVNPRWSGSMELVERAYGLSVFGAHAAACTRAELPGFDVRTSRTWRTSGGKGRRLRADGRHDRRYARMAW